MLSDTPHDSAVSLTVAALDRMLESVAQDIKDQDPGNHATIGFLQGEAKGYRNARSYLLEAEKRFTVPTRGAYEPLTLEAIVLIRSCLDDGTYTAQERKDISTLCDMAVNALLYAEEIQRLRDMPSEKPFGLALDLLEACNDCDLFYEARDHCIPEAAEGVTVSQVVRAFLKEHRRG